MAALSEQLLVVTILVYLLAMLLSAVEFAFGARGPVTRVVARPVRERELVGAAVGAAVPAAGSVDLGRDVPPGGSIASKVLASPGWARTAWLSRAAIAAFGLGALAHLAAAATRGLAAHRLPLGNMYEFVLSVTLIGAVAWLAVLWRRPTLSHLGLYVALTLLLLLGLTGMVLHTEVSPLVPALNSYWLTIHVSGMALAAGIFLLGFVPAALFLMRSGYENGKRRFPYSLGRRMPASGALESLAFRLHALAFPIWTFGVAAGAIWAEGAWGRYWGWDPKETWAFISWVVYACYLHARATPSVRRRTAAWIAVIGWLTMLMNLFGVNLFFVGLHSYAGG